MRLIWCLLAATALSETAAAQDLVCSSLIYGAEDGPQPLDVTITLDTATLTVRMGSDIGWIEGKVRKLPESYSGALKGSNGEVRGLHIDRYTGVMSLNDPTRQ